MRKLVQLAGALAQFGLADDGTTWFWGGTGWQEVIRGPLPQPDPGFIAKQREKDAEVVASHLAGEVILDAAKAQTFRDLYGTAPEIPKAVTVYDNPHERWSFDQVKGVKQELREQVEQKKAEIAAEVGLVPLEQLKANLEAGLRYDQSIHEQSKAIAASMDRLMSDPVKRKPGRPRKVQP